MHFFVEFTYIVPKVRQFVKSDVFTDRQGWRDKNTCVLRRNGL